MTDDQRQEREDWEALTGNAGWRRLVAYATEQYGGADAIVRQLRDSSVPSETVNQILLTASAVQSILRHPSYRMSQLDALARRER